MHPDDLIFAIILALIGVDGTAGRQSKQFAASSAFIKDHKSAATPVFLLT